MTLGKEGDASFYAAVADLAEALRGQKGKTIGSLSGKTERLSG